MQFIKVNPTALADIFWSLFSGMVLWEENKRIIDQNENFLKETLDLAFGIFLRGVSRSDASRVGLATVTP